MDNDRIITLITDMKESLEREMGILKREMELGFRRMDERFDGIDSRLDRQGGLLRAGQTNLVRINDWSESVDKTIVTLQKHITEIEGRLSRLEPSGG